MANFAKHPSGSAGTAGPKQEEDVAFVDSSKRERLVFVAWFVIEHVLKQDDVRRSAVGGTCTAASRFGTGPSTQCHEGPAESSRRISDGLGILVGSSEAADDGQLEVDPSDGHAVGTDEDRAEQRAVRLPAPGTVNGELHGVRGCRWRARLSCGPSSGHVAALHDEMKGQRRRTAGLNLRRRLTPLLVLAVLHRR